jgi:hypothetical protein
MTQNRCGSTYYINSIHDIERLISNVDIQEFLLNIKCSVEPGLSNFKPITLQELNEIVKSLTNKTSICEGISPDIFKKIYHSISSQLMEIINISLQTGEVPAGWKKSTIIYFLLTQKICCVPYSG